MSKLLAALQDEACQLRTRISRLDGRIENADWNTKRQHQESREVARHQLALLERIERRGLGAGEEA